MKDIKDYRPLPVSLTIGKSNIHGLGLIAVADIDSSYDLGVTHVMDKRFDDEVIRTPLAGFINHANSPNCKLVKDKNVFRLVTLKKIKKHEELTVDYSPYYDKKIIANFN